MQNIPEQEPGHAPPMIRVPLPHDRPILTYVLLAVIVGVFFVQVILMQVNFPEPEPITPWGALDYRRILENGEYYRIFTSMFLHANQVHLLFNGLALYVFGRTVESFFGTGRFGLIYLIGGLCGSVASFIFTRGYSVGASGALFAVFGAEMIFLYQNRRILGPAAQEQLRSLAILAALNFSLGLFTQVAATAVRIDNWAHLGGFFAGIVLTWYIGPQYRLLNDRSAPAGIRVVDIVSLRRTWIVPVLFAAGLVLAMIYAIASWRL